MALNLNKGDENNAKPDSEKKGLNLNKSNIIKMIDIIKLYPNIYKKYENKTTEFADYNDYHKYLNEKDPNHYLNKNKKNITIIWFLKYSEYYELILFEL